MTNRILFLSADPKDAAHLRVSQELRDIEEVLRKSARREWTVESRGAVRAADLSDALLECRPRILHFSGHGQPDGMLLIEDETGHGTPVSPAALRALLAPEDELECVVLNACYSEAQAAAIASVVPYAIGTKSAIGDASAIAFSIGFYQAIAAGKSIEFSFHRGTAQIQLRNLPDHLKPVLLHGAPTREPVADSTAVQEELQKIENEADVRQRYNIVVMGKTGVGKSSLVNYLVGRTVVKIGVGKPVTKPGFHRREFDFHGIPAALFDSGGIELKDPEAWRRALHAELKLRGTDRPAEEWFHTIFYCVAAAGGRIEDFEIEAMEAFVEQNYRVAIVLTKSEIASVADVKKLRREISNALGKDLPIVEVCCEEKELRSGERTKTFGIDELRHVVTSGFRASITGRLPDRCVKLLLRIVRRWEREQYAYIREDVTATNATLMHSVLRQRYRKLIADLSGERAERILKDEVRRTLALYDVLAKNTVSIDFRPMVRRRKRTFEKLDGPVVEQRGGFRRWISEIGFGFFDKELRDENVASLDRFVSDVAGELRRSIERMRPAIRKQIDQAAGE